MGTTALLLLLFISRAFAICPEGTTYDARFNKCYKYVVHTASFLLAEKSCESMGGSLVSVSNAFENSYISGISESTTQFWIGINSLYYGSWSWINGDNSTFRNWDTGQPSAYYECGANHISNSHWRAMPCNTFMPYMCQIDPNAVPITGCITPSTPVTTAKPTAPIPTSCPNGHCPDASYTLNPDNCKCYKSANFIGLYNDAYQICANDNATLPIILSQAEDDFIGQFTKGLYDYIWLGLKCADVTTASCTWQDGSPLGYNNFAPGYPNGYQLVLRLASDGLWINRSFSDKNGCVCQKDGIPCYKYISQPASFLLAEKNCEHLGGSLVSVSNAFENAFISQIASNYSSNLFWIGINSLTTTDWTWINGDNSTFRNWDVNNPVTWLPCGAIQLSHNNQWTTSLCNYENPYICQMNANFSRPCPAGRCADPGYILNPNNCKCYKAIGGWTTYNVSLELCANEDATLPIILSANENHFLQYLMLAYGNNYAWLGLQCASNLVTSCTWLDGSHLQGFTNFTSGFPQANELAFMQTVDGGWSTASANSTTNVACQKNGIP